MRDDYQSSKGEPFAMFLYERSLDGSWTDEETGDVQFAGWFGRIGRRIISEDSMGFVSYERYPTVRDAEVVFAEIAEVDEADETPQPLESAARVFDRIARTWGHDR